MVMRRPLAALLAAAGTVCLLARDARAEEVVLAGGTRYDATEVHVVGKKVKFTYEVGGGRATVTLPFEALEPRSLFLIVLARTQRDPKSMASLGWFALERGLLPEAAHWFRKAAVADPSLVPERDRGLLAIQTKELERLLESAEGDLRKGRFDLGTQKVQEVLARAEPGSDLAAKAQGLVDLAQRTREKESRRLAAEAKARDEAIANAEKAALDAALVRADKSILGAIERRARIAVPGVAPAKIRADLEAAEAMLREGRRLLLGAVDIVPARREEVLAREAEAMRLLVATLIDLADHHRQASRWTKALDYVRAALLIEPNNARALEVQRQIEEARRTPEPYYFDDPWGGGRGPLIRDYYPYVSPHSYYHHPTPLLRGSSWFSWRGRHGGFWAGW